MIDLGLSDEEQQILNAVVPLLEEHGPVSRLRARGAEVSLHARLADWGWFRIGLADEQDGFGVGAEVLLFLEAGRFLLPPSVLATALAVQLADGDLRSHFVDGSQRATLALSGAPGCNYCFDRDAASHLVVFGADRIWLSPVDAFNGFRIDSFDETVVTEKGDLEIAPDASSEPIDRAMLLTAAMLAGIARASSELAVEYAKVREQFGQPIGAFQAIKHLCADVATRAYASEAQVKVAGAMAADEPASASFQTRAAAITAMMAARDNAAAAIQVHGGIGFTAECNVHFYLKRAHLLERLLGGLGRQQQALLSFTAESKLSARR